MNDETAALKIGEAATADVAKVIALVHPLTVPTRLPETLAAARKSSHRVLEHARRQHALTDGLDLFVDSSGSWRS